MGVLQSGWCDQPLQLTGMLDAARWTQAVSMDVPNLGSVLYQNDARFLYVGIDAQTDTGNDPGTGDYFWLTFDVDKSKTITPNVDVNYGTSPSRPNGMVKHRKPVSMQQPMMGPSCAAGGHIQPPPSGRGCPSRQSLPVSGERSAAWRRWERSSAPFGRDLADGHLFAG